MGKRDEIERREADKRLALDIATGVAPLAADAFLPGTALPATVATAIGRYFAARALGFWRHLEQAGYDPDAIASRLETDERLAQLFADAYRATIQSELAAKRYLLAEVAKRALDDSAVPDLGQRLVRASEQVDAVEVRVLAIVAEERDERPDPQDPSSETRRRPADIIYRDELHGRWPGGGESADAALAVLIGAGLVDNAQIGSFGGPPSWRATAFGRRFLDRLRAGRLDDELREEEEEVEGGDTMTQGATPQGVFVKAGEGRTLVARVRFWTDQIAAGGEGHVLPGTAWCSGTIDFAPNSAHGITGNPDPPTFNNPEQLIDALIRAAKAQGVTLLDPSTRSPL